jgi:O-antigen/teichoic acid export membrane protein
MSNLKKLASDTAIYGISSIGGRLLNVLLVPFYTAVFAPGEYGIVGELYAYVAFLNVIYTYGLETAYFRYASRHKEDQHKIYNSAFTSILISSFLFSGILCLLATPIVEFLEFPGRERYVYWFSAILSIDAIMAIPFAELRLQNRPIRFAVAKLGNILLNVGLNIFFLLVLRDIFKGEYLAALQPLLAPFYRPEWGVDYVFLANLVANGALLFILWDYVFTVKLRLHKFYWQSMLVYAYPLMFMGLAGVTNQMLSVPMLKKLLPESFYPDISNQAAVGIYVGCYKLSIFMNLTIQAFRYASEPFFFSQASSRNSPELFSKVMYYFVIACCLIFFGVTVNVNWIAPIILRDPAYLTGLEIVPVLLLAYMFMGIYSNLSIWFKLTDRTQFGTWFTGSGALLTVILNIILIPLLGYMGAALTSLVVYFYMAAICYIYGQKHYPIPYKLKGAAGYIIGASLLAYAILSIPFESEAIATASHIGITLLVFAGVFFYEKKNFAVKAS